MIALLAILVAGCGGGEPRLAITRWTLVAPNGTSEVILPAHLNDRLPDGTSRFALKAHVELPESLRDQPLTLAMENMNAVARVYADGREATAIDGSPFDRYRSFGPHRWRVAREETRGPTLDLEIDCEHTWTESAWIDAVPALSATPSGGAWIDFALWFDRTTAIVGLATTLLVSTTFGLLFVLDRRRKVHAWHALQGLLGATYPALILGLLQPIFGPVEQPLGAGLVTISAVASVQFISGIFDRPAPSRAWWLLAAAAILAGAVSGGPFQATTVMAPIAIFSVLSASVFGIRTLVVARRTRKPTLLATLAALGFPITAVLATPDILGFLGLGDPFHGLRGGALGLGVVSFLQATALSSDHVASLNHADDLNAELATRVALLEANNLEIRSLNDELRRQVSARSQRIEEALARLGPIYVPRRFEPGEIIDERYRVTRCIGEGGMGTVYEVARVSDQKRLALKVLQAARSGADLARLAREAEIASQLDHPNVVGIVDVDVAASGAVFLVMEYVDGESLDALDARYGDAAWARGVLRQVAEGLAAMHAQGIVHRDLKPGNVLVTRGPRGDVAKIGDFGISTRTATGSGDETIDTRDSPADASDVTDETADMEGIDRALTRTGQVLGTPLYMAPEVARGAKNATPASDVYSLGVMGFELLTGDVPAGFGTLAHLRGRGEQPTPTLIGIEGLDPAVARCLSRALA